MELAIVAKQERRAQRELVTLGDQLWRAPGAPSPGGDSSRGLHSAGGPQIRYVPAAARKCVRQFFVTSYRRTLLHARPSRLSGPPRTGLWKVPK